MSVQESAYSPKMEDLELVSLAQRGHAEAFSELVRRYHEPIFRAAYTMVGNADDAADLAQDIFLKAYRSLSSFRGGARFYTWLYRIGINCCLDWRKSRHQRHRWLRCEESEADLKPGGTFSRPEPPDARVLRRELRDAIAQALAILPEGYRDTLILREIDGRACREIADVMGCSDGTVKSRLFRAKRLLRETLAPAYEDWCRA